MRRAILAGLALIAVQAIFVAGGHKAKANRWGEGYFPNLPVVNQDGKTLHFYDDLIKGRIVVVSFIFTTCADLCPIETARLAEVKEMLGDVVGRDISFLSITVDPEHDTPDTLKAFADAYDAGPGWNFVTGKPEDIKAILAKFGDRSGERGLSSHRNEIMLGNDPVGDWQRDSTFGDIDSLAMTIRAMDPQWTALARQPQQHVKASDTGYRIGEQPGEAMFAKLCAPCHTIGAGDRIGPDLRGVTERRDQAWLTDFIRYPQKKIAEKDAVALALASQFPAALMPRLGVTESDATDLIAYLRDQTPRSSVSARSVTAPR